MPDELNYDDMIILDSEDLAEGGIKQAYEELMPTLKKYLASPAVVEEEINNDLPSYSVMCMGNRYPIYGPDNQVESWGLATHAFFDIINRQLASSEFRFYAFNGGNDLGGMFLKVKDAEAFKKSLPKEERPYLPTLEGPWHGMEH